MPQMMPIWWVVIFLTMVTIMISSMAVLYGFIIISPRKLYFEMSKVDSWWI